MILDEVSDAEVTGFTGRRSSFEIKINNKLVFSKLSHLKFPKAEAVVAQVLNAQKGLPVEDVTETMDSSCSVQ
jgi:selT/selW/selH-like putative selenoprotein